MRGSRRQISKHFRVVQQCHESFASWCSMCIVDWCLVRLICHTVHRWFVRFSKNWHVSSCWIYCVSSYISYLYRSILTGFTKETFVTTSVLLHCFVLQVARRGICTIDLAIEQYNCLAILSSDALFFILQH
jgi:hypothetical protein